MSSGTSSPPSSPPFSARLRAGTRERHEEAERSAFMAALLGGGLGVEDYTRYTGQLWFVYRALEACGERLAEDPVAGPFVRPELARTPELERDLDHLHGGGSWRGELAPLPATAAYAARIEECARDWPAGWVAHHYTRYLGDLSGGQAIRSRAERLWGFPSGGDGVRFYVFERIANPAAYKRDYRKLLDALPLDAAQEERVIEECRAAFALNTAVFEELGGTDGA
ncbi:heme oxygenase (biliverdin-producing) [Streptomyces polyrhachis]|uniref:Heme oxygenase (Biliverdin-producing) n=1 Tax=Streptomyces polyrhachis TaxID=1282885 RepID=A0ABW2GKL9_9ACTN